MPTLKKLIHHMTYLVKGVRVLALVGKSGTGKSFRAQLVAQKYEIDLIIDDGLLIRGQRILAGRSAKKEKAILAAIKTALFVDPSHAESVRRAMSKERFKRVLIIGTSIKMVRKIASRLALPNPSKIIRIEDVATQREIQEAIRARDTHGKHIIPVPAIEVKRNYPQIFLDSIRIFLKKGFHVVSGPRVFEKTVVRPEYSKRGRVTISKPALTQMVLHCVQEFDPSLQVDKVIINMNGGEYRLDVVLNIPYGSQVALSLHQLQGYILKNIEDYTGLILKQVDITVGRVRRKNE